MKTSRTLLSLILSLLLIFCTTAPAFAKTNDDSFHKINPLYEDVLTEEKLEALRESQESTQEEVKNSPFSAESAKKKAGIYTSIDSAAAYVRDEMIAREREIYYQYKTTSTDYAGIFEKIAERAMSEDLATSSSAGDYLSWNWAEREGAYAVSRSGSYYIYTFYLGYLYYTNSSQESQVNFEVKKAINEMDLKSSSKSTFDKICQIYNYVCKTNSYDFAHVNNYNYFAQYTAYGALIKHSSVCQGYATAIYKLCKEVGIPVRVITSEEHAWNIVKLGSKYYHIDATWDDRNTYYGSPTDSEYWGQYVNHRYFLKSDNDFNEEDHYKEAPYLTAEFKSKYPIASTSYCIYIPYSNGAEDHRITHQAACAVCGEGMAEPVKCSLQNGKCTVCKQEGVHNGNTNKITDCRKTVYCSVCNENLHMPSSHTGTQWSYGVSERTGPCSVCGSIVTEPCITNLNGTTTNNSIKLSCDAIKNASKYEFKIYINGKWKNIETGTNSANVTGLSCGTKYAVNARALVNGIYTEWTAIQYIVTRPATPTGLKTTARSDDGTRLRLSWNSQKEATGYNVYSKVNGTWKYCGSTSNNYWIFNVTPGYEYYYKVVAYIEKTNYTGYGSAEYHTCASCVPVDKAPSLSSGAPGVLLVQWNRVRCHGYLVQYSTTADFKNPTSVYVKSQTSYKKTFNNLKSGQRYYARIRSYRYLDSTIVYGPYSPTASYTVK